MLSQLWPNIYLLRRNIVSLCPHVNLLIMIHTGNDEEHSGTPGSALEKSTKAEYDGSFVFLKYRENESWTRFKPGIDCRFLFVAIECVRHFSLLQ